MKRLLFSLLASLLLCAPLEARRRWIPKASGTSYTLIQTPSTTGSGAIYNFDGNNNIGLASGSPNFQVATKFIAAETTTVTRIRTSQRLNGTPSGYNLQCAIYTDSSNKPGTLVGTASSLVAVTSAVEGATLDFDGVSASITSSTTYWVVQTTDRSSFDFTNWTLAGSWLFDSAQTGYRAVAGNDNVWTNTDDSAGLFVPYFAIYKSP